MSEIAVRAKNDKKVSRRLNFIARKLQGDDAGLTSVLMKAGLAVERTAVDYYLSGPRPDHLDRVTGTLAASVNTQVKGKNSVSVGTNVEYARIHEYGGTIEQDTGQVVAAGRVYDMKRIIHMPARPFLRTAARDEKEDVDQYITAYLKSVIREGA